MRLQEKGKNFFYNEKKLVFHALLFLLGAGLLYLKSFYSSWTYDDFMVLVENPDIRSFRQFIQNSYPGRPLRELTYLLDYQFFGLNPAGYHLQQVFWHGLNAFLLFILVKRLGGSGVVPWLAALVFLVHPLQVEVVANVSHRKDLLALAFSLLAILAYMESFQSCRRQLSWLLFAVGLYLVACQAKQHVVALPLVFVAYELCFVDAKKRVLTRFRALAVLVAGIGFSAFLYWLFEIYNSPEFSDDIVGLQRKFAVSSVWSVNAYYLTIVKSVSFQLLRVVWPLQLSPEYIYSVPAGWGDPWVLASLVLLALYGGSLWLSFRRNSAIFFALVLMGVVWAPAFNLFGYFLYPAADRYFYSPSAGLFTAVAFISSSLLSKWQRGGPLAIAALLVTFCALSWQQIDVWRTKASLGTRILQVNPLSNSGMKMLGEAAYEKGDFDTSLMYFNRAFEVYPWDAETLNYLGAVFWAKGQLEEALEFFRRSIDLNPYLAHTHLNLGLALKKIGDFETAIDFLRKAIDLNPGIEKSYQVLVDIYLGKNQSELAEAVFLEGVSVNQNSVNFPFEYGVLLYNHGRFGNALRIFETVLEKDPVHEDALVNSALALFNIGDREIYLNFLEVLEKINYDRAETVKLQILAVEGK